MAGPVSNLGGLGEAAFESYFDCSFLESRTWNDICNLVIQVTGSRRQSQIFQSFFFHT